MSPMAPSMPALALAVLAEAGPWGALVAWCLWFQRSQRQGAVMTVPVDVLIIEDDKQLGILVKDLLRAHWPMPDTRYLIAECLRQALGFVRILPPSLIIMDLHMDDAEGLNALHAVLDTLGALQQRVPIVLLSGHLTEEEGLEAITLGAADYIIKGSPTQSMLLAIRKVWARG